MKLSLRGGGYRRTNVTSFANALLVYGRLRLFETQLDQYPKLRVFLFAHQVDQMAPGIGRQVLRNQVKGHYLSARLPRIQALGVSTIPPLPTTHIPFPWALLRHGRIHHGEVFMGCLQRAELGRFRDIAHCTSSRQVCG